MPKREKPSPPVTGRRTTRRTSARKAKAKGQIAPPLHAEPAPPSPAAAEAGSPAPSSEGAPFQMPPPPEVAFASRVPPPEPERPRPIGRRAIFFDVENTSRSSDVKRMLEQLAIDRGARATELVASGNWRVIGYETARLLAGHGAHLVHSAPATGVRDWSDLRIAVAAGVWLASARSGDELDIVSDDKAFDVLGDAAAALGVVFRRLSYREAVRVERVGTEGASASRRRGRRRGGGQAAERATHPPHTAKRAHPAEAANGHAPPQTGAEAATTAMQEAGDDQVLSTVKELVAASPSGITLNAVANRLRELGFQRAPGSPRLVTRLRALKELDVSPRGTIRLRGAGASHALAPEGVASPRDAAAAHPSRPRARGGRGRGRAKTPV